MMPPERSSRQSPLAAPVTELWGVGSERGVQLARLDIRTVEDLLLHRPRRYEDRSRFRAISELTTDEAALTRGTVVAMGLKRFRKGAKSVFELILEDGTGRLHCHWWNLPFMEKYFMVGDEIVAFGKLIRLKPRTMDHAETEVVEDGEERFIHFDRITPIYPLTEGLRQRWLRSLIWRTLERYEVKISERTFGVPSSDGPASTAQQRVEEHPAKPPEGRTPGFPIRANAIHKLHFPETLEDVEIARRRLALDEFMELQLQMQERRKRFQANATALPCGGDQNRLIKPFLKRLGFQFTAAQTKVLREIRADMAGAHPMRRLLQGDVGSGKTVVAACAALMAMESGFSVALMVPTEILAEQHYRNFSGWLELLGVGVELRTGSRKTSKNQPLGMNIEHQAAPGLATRNPQPGTLTVGTHALLTEGCKIPNLGLVIIDEEHKFGVAQREQLVRKGRYPHVLVMTATPIPRTLGLTLYGDLDVSMIDELPAGRGHIQTFIRGADKLPKVWEFVRQTLAAGRQAYVVYPRVEETDGGSVKAVLKEFENVKRQFAAFRVGLLHGRLAAREKDAVMTAFRRNAISVLVATSLVEVGLDVPNATVLVVENAEQFGLSQLHQLRGRIGRGTADAHCILVAAAKTPEAGQRLRVLEETNDGFRIAEADLKLRGPGELLGGQQSGLPRFRFGNLVEDLDLIQQARVLVAQRVGGGVKR